MSLHFYDRLSDRYYSDGEIVDYEYNGPMEEPTVEPVITFDDLEVVFSFLRETFPDGWMIEDGKIVQFVLKRKEEKPCGIKDTEGK